MTDKYTPDHTELERLQKARDDAKTPEEKQKAQRDVDEYFMGKPEKRGGKKKRKKNKKRNFRNEDWEYDNEWGDY